MNELDFLHANTGSTSWFDIFDWIWLKTCMVQIPDVRVAICGCQEQIDELVWFL